MNFSHTLNIFSCFLLAACGTRAGNPPQGTTQPKGFVSIQLVDSNSINNITAELNIAAISARTEQKIFEDIEFRKALSLDAQVKSIATGVSLNTGRYNQLRIQLDKSSPVILKDSQGQTKTIALKSKKSVLAIPRTFEIVANKNLKITLRVDIGKSLKQQSTATADLPTTLDSIVAFDPSIDLYPSQKNSSLRGENLSQDIIGVCVYLNSEDEVEAEYEDSEDSLDLRLVNFDDRVLALDDDGEGDQDDDGDDLAEEDDIEVIEQGQEAEGNESDACEKAFAIEQVENQSFQFEYLHPGTYDLVGFTSSGSSQILSKDIKVDIGTAKEYVGSSEQN